ncbi:hypothetical protein VTO73DRAFT_11487 [Trametes versicolor]
MSSSEYEDSQPAETMTEGCESKPRPSRTSHAGMRLTSALYEQGGALDSQTSDSQWLSSFIRDESPSNDYVDNVDASVQTDLISPMELADTSTCCDEVEADNDALRDELARVEAAHKGLESENQELRNDLARLEAMYDGVMGQLESVRGVLAEDPVILDPTEQSQLQMALPPTRTALSHSVSGPRRSGATAFPSKQRHRVDIEAESRTAIKSLKSTSAPVPKRGPCASEPSAVGSMMSSSGSAPSGAPAPTSTPVPMSVRVPTLRPGPQSSYATGSRKRSPRRNTPQGVIIISSSDEEDTPRRRVPLSGSAEKRRRFM